MFTAYYMPSSSQKHTRHGFPTEDAAWEYICPNCPDRAGIFDADPCACWAEWLVEETLEHYLDLHQNFGAVLADLIDAFDGPEEDEYFREFWRVMGDLRDTYEALPDEAKAVAPLP